MVYAPRVWLITGASSGFGRAVTEAVLHNGEVAVATVRSPEALQDLTAKYNTDRLLVLACDVTRRNDISAAFKKAYEHFGRCNVVFNNAGMSQLAEVENEEQDTMARKLFEVNFWGAVNVSREAVRCFRELNTPGQGGLLLVNSSMAGQIGLPGGSFYSASKHALEGLTDTLVKEIDPQWHIKVSIIEASFFKTRLSCTELPIFAPPLAYTNPSLSTQQIRHAAQSGGIDYGDVVKAAERIYSLSKEEDLPLRFPLGKAAVSEVRGQCKQVLEDIERFAGWSEGLEITK